MNNIEVDLTNSSEAIMFISSNMAKWNLQWIHKIKSNMDYNESYTFDIKQDL